MKEEEDKQATRQRTDCRREKSVYNVRDRYV